MDPALLPVVRNAAWWMVVGGCLGFAGGCWPPYRQWYAPLEEALRVIAAHPIGWRMIHAGFITGVWMLVVGSSSLAYALRGAPGGRFALAAAVVLALAALLWSANITHRLSSTVWAANELARTGSIPASYARTMQLASYAFAAFSVLAYLAVALTGGAALQAQLAPGAVGWGLVVWGVTLGLVVGRDVPLVAYVPFIALGGCMLYGRVPYAP